MKNKKNRPSQKAAPQKPSSQETTSQKPMRKPMPPRESSTSETPNSSESMARSVASELLPSVDAEFDTAEPLLAEVQSFLAKRSELAKRLKEEIAATELRLEQLRKTAASLMPERSQPVAKEKKPKKNRPTAKDGAGKDGATQAADEGVSPSEVDATSAE